MNKVLRKVTDFRVITLAVASALAIAAANADARAGEGRSAQQATQNTAVRQACSAAVVPTVQSMRREPTAKAA